MDMQVILMALIGILGGKQVWDVINKKMALNAEEKKAEMAMEMEKSKNKHEFTNSERDEIKEMLKAQIEEYKLQLSELKDSSEKLRDEFSDLEVRYGRLEEKYNSIRKRLLGYTQHTRGGRHKDDNDNGFSEN
jgi:predicted nuclease with TOPRIM domain